MVWLIVWLLCGVVTAIIAPSKGRNPVGCFFIGMVLGIFGIILVAVPPSVEQRTSYTASYPPASPYSGGSPRLDYAASQAPQSSFEGLGDRPLASPSSQAVVARAPAYDARKWQVLKEVDAEIGSAARRVAALGPKFEDELAEKYLVLGDKTYLEAIERQVTERAEAEHGAREALAASIAAEHRASAMEEMDKYKALIAAHDGVDPKENIKVLNIEPYVGRFKMAEGGIKVALADGSFLLRKGYFNRRFVVDPDKDYSV